MSTPTVPNHHYLMCSVRAEIAATQILLAAAHSDGEIERESALEEHLHGLWDSLAHLSELR